MRPSRAGSLCGYIKTASARGPRGMPHAVIKIEDDEPGGREREAGGREREREAMWAALEGLVRCLEALVDPPAVDQARKRRRA